MIPRIILSGDQEEARLRAREGIRQLGILKGLMSFGQLKQDVRKVRYTDGSEIVCRSIFGIEDVQIYVPPEKKKEIITEICVVAGMGGGSRRLLRSTDKGETWGTTSGMPGSPYTRNVHSLANIGGGTLLAGTDGLETGDYVERVYKSIDCGATWRHVSLPDPLSGYSSGIKRLLYLEDGICLAGSWGQRLYRSVNSGTAWIDVYPDPNLGKILDLAYLEDGICIGTFWAADGRIGRSTDYGLTWNHVSPFVEGDWCITYLEDGICLAGASGYYGSHPTTWYARLQRSTDYGLTWARSTNYDVEYDENTPPEEREQRIALSMTYLENGICLVGTYRSGKILRSTDYGLTWTDLGPQGEEPHIYSLLYYGEGICFAGTGRDPMFPYGVGKILKSIDYGLTWTDTGYISGTSSIYALAKSEMRRRKRY